jgi:hypothetical protein
MNINNNKNINDQEIDITSVFKGVSVFFQSVNRRIYHMIRFVMKHRIILSVLIALGFGLGLYFDKTHKTYNNCLIVRTNFGSSDYLYSKIDFIYSKINDGDTKFLSSIGIKNPNNLTFIEIHPVIDIYGFINNTSNSENELNPQNDQSFQVFKLMAEEGDMKTLINDRTTSRNYDFHTINFVTRSFNDRKEILEPLLKYLDNNEYFNNAKVVYIENSKSKVEANKTMIAQIDGLLSTFVKENLESSQNGKSVYINQNSQINDLVKTKDDLVRDTGNIRRELQSHDKVIKESSCVLNLHNTRTIDSKLRVVLPAIFLLSYLLIIAFFNFYNKQAALYKEEKI